MPEDTSNSGPPAGRTRSGPLRRWALAIALALIAHTLPARSQEVSLEYQVKAAYLYNFVRFIDWGPAPDMDPLMICLAGHNPFGSLLTDLVQGENVEGRPIATSIVSQPDPGCHVLFIPADVPAAPFLRAAENRPVLTVGEASDFIAGGGIIGFYIEDDRVRFTIDAERAQRAKVNISSRLLRLGRPPAGSVP